MAVGASRVCSIKGAGLKISLKEVLDFMVQYYPIFLRIEQRLCVVIGGGKVAERKIFSLLEAKAKIKVIAPEVTQNIQKLADQGKIELIKRPYQNGDLDGAWLVIAATNREDVQKEVFLEAEKRQIFCNVVDCPDKCSFIVPSVIKRGRLNIAISTSGASPALAKRIRENLEEIFGKEYEEFLELMAQWRKIILERDLPEEERRNIFEQLALSPIPLWLKRNERQHLKVIAKIYNLPFDD